MPSQGARRGAGSGAGAPPHVSGLSYTTFAVIDATRTQGSARFHGTSDWLVLAPNLAWPEVDIRHPIVKETGLEVELENAANACVLAEVWFRRAAESRNLVNVTVSEGIGTGVLANGELMRGLNGMAGEFGHVPLDPGA
jgi:predicted NBD/HSP70 family sugar kinase